MVASFLGGLALFLYGQFLLERSLQKTSRVYLQGLIKLLTKYRGAAILAGSLLAVGMQSSTIPVFTLIGLINRGVLQLGQAIGIVLGASIGTTITIQAISFDVSGFALWFIVIGFVISKFLNSSKGELVLGLGFMFYGIRLIGSGISLFKGTDFGNDFLNGLCASPLKNMSGAFILTVLSQSTLAALAVGIVLMRDGGFGIAGTIPIILGAHLGAGVLPLIYSWKVSGTIVGRQLGIANLVYRIIGVALFSFLIQPLGKVITLLNQWFSAGTARELANAHTVFVLATVCLFAPFVGLYAKFIKRLLPERKEIFKEIELDMAIIKEKEMELAEGVYQMLKVSLSLWEQDKVKEIYKIEKQGVALRFLEDNVWECISGSAKDSIGKEGEDVLKIISNLGVIRDITGFRMVDFTRRRIVQGLDFSMEGLNEVLNIHKKIIEEYDVLLGILNNSKYRNFNLEIPIRRGVVKGNTEFPLRGDSETPEGCNPMDKLGFTPNLKSHSEIERINQWINQAVSLSYASHINRICKGFRESKETRLLHTDAITLLEHIHWHIQKIMTNVKIQISNES